MNFKLILGVLSLSQKPFLRVVEKRLVLRPGYRIIFHPYFSKHSLNQPICTPLFVFRYSNRDAGRSELHTGRGRHHWPNRSGHLVRPREIAAPADPRQRRHVATSDTGRVAFVWNTEIHTIYNKNRIFSDCKSVWWGHVHDGPISCIRRNVFFPDIHLACGGHVVSIWSLNYEVNDWNI